MLDFWPEFINRIENIIRFRSFTEEDLGRIVQIQLKSLRKRLADRRKRHDRGVGLDPITCQLCGGTSHWS